jgi:hypothetical protein
MSKALSMIATGVIMRDRETAKEYGLHSECADKLSNTYPVAFDPFTGRYVIIGPLFAPPSEWECPMCKNGSES